jgi:hypothetical protein
MTAVNPEASRQVMVEAALVLLERMGLTPADLAAVPQSRPRMPTFAEYVRLVSAAVSTGPRPHFEQVAMPDSRCAEARTTCLRRVGSPNSLTSRSWASTSMIAGHCVVGYFLPCHSRRPASRAEVSVPTIEVGHHCLAATGVMPRAVQSRAIQATDSPCSSTGTAASRSASASTGLISSRAMCRFLRFGSSGLA